MGAVAAVDSAALASHVTAPTLSAYLRLGDDAGRLNALAHELRAAGGPVGEAASDLAVRLAGAVLPHAEPGNYVALVDKATGTAFDLLHSGRLQQAFHLMDAVGLAVDLIALDRDASPENIANVVKDVLGLVPGVGEAVIGFEAGYLVGEMSRSLLEEFTGRDVTDIGDWAAELGLSTSESIRAMVEADQSYFFGFHGPESYLAGLEARIQPDEGVDSDGDGAPDMSPAPDEPDGPADVCPADDAAISPAPDEPDMSRDISPDDDTVSPASDEPDMPGDLEQDTSAEVEDDGGTSEASDEPEFDE
ncbi:hypothetical protein ACWKSP_37145 [Micromonosporaceae bacterium Da 78-11]